MAPTLDEIRERYSREKPEAKPSAPRPTWYACKKCAAKFVPAVFTDERQTKPWPYCPACSASCPYTPECVCECGEGNPDQHWADPPHSFTCMGRNDPKHGTPPTTSEPPKEAETPAVIPPGMLPESAADRMVCGCGHQGFEHSKTGSRRCRHRDRPDALSKWHACPCVAFNVSLPEFEKAKASVGRAFEPGKSGRCMNCGLAREDHGLGGTCHPD